MNYLHAALRIKLAKYPPVISSPCMRDKVSILSIFFHIRENLSHVEALF